MPPLPVSLNLRLPTPRWAIADPEVIGLTGAAFAAVRPGPDAYTPLVTVSGGIRTADTGVDQIAAESVQVLGAQTSDVLVLRRVPSGTDEAPGLAQLLAASLDVDGTPQELRQAQVIVTTPVEHDPHQRVVLLFTLTCTLEQLDEVAPEFNAFVESAQPATPPAPEETDRSEDAEGPEDQ